MKNRFVKFLPKYLYAGLASSYVFWGGFLRPQNRTLIHQICEWAGYYERVSPIPSSNISELVSEDIDVHIKSPFPKDANVSLSELIVLSSFVKTLQPKTIFEIGTFNGRTTLNMAYNAPPGATIFTLDLPKEKMNLTKLPIDPGEKRHVDKDISGELYRGDPMATKIIQLLGDSADFDYSPYHQKIDLFFVDGSHTYEYVLNDTEKALACVAPGGYIFWHDYISWDGVTEGLNELYRSRRDLKGLKRIRGTSLVYLTVGGKV